MDLASRIIEWIGSSPGVIGLSLLALSAAIEYVFPPFPGDTITLFGAFLVARRGWPGPAVFLAILAGSVAGFMLDFWIGRRLALAPGRLAGTRFASAQPAITKLLERFHRRGALYLVINRFVPSLRGLFFLAAGMAGLSAGRVFVFGLISATLWNGLLFLAGDFVGAHWDRVLQVLHTYGTLFLVVLALAVALWAFGRWRKRHTTPAE